MHDSPIPLRPFAEKKFASLAFENQARISKTISRLGGEVEFCSVLTEPARREAVNLQRKTISQLANQILTGEIDVMIFVTAAGVRYFVEQASKLVDRQRLIHGLTDILTVAGSSSASSAFQAVCVSPTIALDGSDSWRDILTALDRRAPVANMNVGLEESESIHGLRSGIEARGGRVYTLPIYLCVTAPFQIDSVTLPAFADRLLGGQFHALLFTRPAEVSEFFLMARDWIGWRRLDRLAEGLLLASMHPDATELLRDRGILVDFTTTAIGTDIEVSLADFAGQFPELEQS